MPRSFALVSTPEGKSCLPLMRPGTAARGTLPDSSLYNSAYLPYFPSLLVRDEEKRPGGCGGYHRLLKRLRHLIGGLFVPRLKCQVFMDECHIKEPQRLHPSEKEEAPLESGASRPVLVRPATARAAPGR